MKKMLSKIKKVAKNICIRMAYGLSPLKNILLFESTPDLSDNTKAVFDEMIERGLNERYTMVWRISDKNLDAAKIPNVSYVDVSTKKGKAQWRKYMWQSKILISCNDFLIPTRKGQLSFYLSHGTPFKSVRNYYTIPCAINYAFSASEDVKEICAYEFNFPVDKIVGLGFPRNDVLTNRSIDIKKHLKTTCKTVVVWYPTYRQHRAGLKTGVTQALPIIHDFESAHKLNQFAAEQDILLVLKPHFAQDLSYIKDVKLSNIRFIDDNFFASNGISSYEFVGNCDALITDYSSIYFDFLLCNKPVAVIWEDFEEYKKNPGVINNYAYYMSGAEKIYTLDELEQFLRDVKNGVDNKKDARNQINTIVNYAADGKNAARVVDFILEKIDGEVTHF